MIYPAVGALLLTVGIYRRRAYRRWISQGDSQLLPDDDFDDFDDYLPPPKPPRRGTVLIVAGALISLWGTGRVVTALMVPPTPQMASDIEVGECITGQAFEQPRLNEGPVDCCRLDATLQLASKGRAEAMCPDGSRGEALYLVLGNDARTYLLHSQPARRPLLRRRRCCYPSGLHRPRCNRESRSPA